MMPISRRSDPVMSAPPPRTAPAAPPAEGLDKAKAPTRPETSPEQAQALAKDRQYLSHLSDSFQQLPPEKVEGYGLEDPIKAQADAEQQAFQDILANIVPEA